MKSSAYIAKAGKILRCTPRFGNIPGNVTSFERPEYSHNEAQLTADWLKGHDRPITNMVPADRDPFIRKVLDKGVRPVPDWAKV